MRFTLLILMALLPCLIFAATLSVKQDGSGDYTVIQDALDAASPGDTVLVYPGRYFENLTIESDNITLMSLEGTTGDPAYIDSTIIDGNHSDRCFRARSEGTIIRGLSFTNGLSIGAGGGISISNNTTVTNCKIFHNKARTGGGINIIGSEAYLSGVDVYQNYALQLGGGIYATSVTGFSWSITFDPINRCSIYNNRAGAGQDIYIQHATSDLYMPLDTFSVAEPHNYHAVYLSEDPIEENYQINFDILNAHHEEIDGDLYVSTVGDDNNDGFSPDTALKTIHEAIYRVASDSLNQNTVHILPGDYSRTDNDQIFPIAMKSWVIVQGSGIDTTTVIGEPHPLMYDNIVTLVFSIIMAPDVFLSDMSITSCNINHYCIAIGGDYRYSSVEFSHLRIYNIESSDSYTGNYEAVYFGATSERESLWENVTIENIGPARVQMITSSGGISETGEISAMKGRFSNCTFRNTLSTFQSSSVWGPPLISIKGNQRLEFENCVFENLSVADDDANVIQIGGIQYPQQQNHFSFKNSLFSNISSHDNMILIGSRNNPKIDITNCTFAGNQGDAYTLMVNGEVNIVNSIFDNDTPYQIKINPMDGNPNEHTNLTIDHSLVKDGIDGILPYPVPGNTINFLPSSMDANPHFSGGFDIHDPLFYSLSEFSPCIDSGTRDISDLNLPPYDLAGNWRIWNGRIDMGCFELGAPPVGNDDPSVPAVPAFSLTAYPNPFSAFTNIRAEIPARGDRGAEAINTARIVIYNLRGQMVRAMELDPGVRQQVLTWDGRDSRNQRCSNGIYFLNLVVDGRSIISKKVTLIR